MKIFLQVQLCLGNFSCGGNFRLIIWHEVYDVVAVLHFMGMLVLSISCYILMSALHVLFPSLFLDALLVF